MYQDAYQMGYEMMTGFIGMAWIPIWIVGPILLMRFSIKFFTWINRTTRKSADYDSLNEGMEEVKEGYRTRLRRTR